MSRGTPSMVALLGLLAVAGYKNRDKIKEMLGGANPQAGTASGPLDQSSADGGLLGKLGGLLGGASAGSLFGGGLRDLVERFKQNGHSEAADSWVNTGPNRNIESAQLEQAIGPEVLDALEERTGLTRAQLLEKLSRELPDAVNEFTPNGRLPTDDEAGRFV